MDAASVRGDSMVRMVMKSLGMALGGVLLACGGCVVHEVPVAPPVSQAAPPAPAPTAQNCREFQKTVIVGGKQQQAYGTTCQQPDGSWQIASSPEAGAPPVAAAAPPYVVAPYPVYPYPPPYYAYPPYYGSSIGFGFGFGRRWH
jgi:hypothetical protein